MPADLHVLRRSIQQCMMRDRYFLRGQLRRLRKDDEAGLTALQEKMKRSVEKAILRRQALPSVDYNESLPVSGRRQEIAKAIRDHQVVVIAGETGSGKTTQLPKICLEAGRGIYGMIGHTQPRRLAARSVANRIAEELQVALGQQVGYQVRFTDYSGDNTLVKLMTDGILLAEIQNDRFLNRYDTIIIDEAHERSLNIDFLLGYLKLILPRRPDLKLIITSATIDVERFSKHFNNAPVIEVSGRTYPVDMYYRPLDELALSGRDADQRLQQGILSAVREIEQLERAGQGKRLGDALVFLSGERDIRETHRFLKEAKLAHTEILPLYARLSANEQNRIFQGHSGRRIILSTNVAETSLTVPGIHYVIDPGNARISRYSVRSRVQRLPIEPVSQASANQRMGRCGRVASGVCFRLYSEDDFNHRPAFTDAEILRTNLAAVILQMLRMGLGDVARFPFVDAPENKAVNDGFKLLQELGAVTDKRHLTMIGRQLGKLPVDPRLGRMVIEAHKNGSLREALIIVSALTIQDPRERPAEKQQASDQAHREFYHKESDFLTLVNVWDEWQKQGEELSKSQLRKYCKTQFLSYLRMIEWQDLHRQLVIACRDLNFRCNEEAASYESVHRSLLSGLLSGIGNKDDDADYLGARNRKFYVFPASALYKKKPRWIMAAELVETSRLFARMNARIEPEWIESLAGSLLRRHYNEPHWEKKRAQVVAFEQVTLYGLIIVARRRVHYGPIDPVISREIFIRDALVENNYQSSGQFQTYNQALIDEVVNLEDKSRRRDILVDPETLYAFYNEYIPAEIVNGVSFEHWRKQAEKEQPDVLHLSRDYLMRHDASQVSAESYPDCYRYQGTVLPLSYHFVPGDKDDGVTVTVPVQALSLLPTHQFDWLVPGMLYDKCVALVRALPKVLRRNFVPVPDYVQGALEAMSVCDSPLTQVLGRQLTRMSGILVPDDAWQQDVIDPCYHMNIRVLDENGKELGQNRNMKELQEQFAGRSEAGIRAQSHAMEQDNLTSWSFGELPLSVSGQFAGMDIESFPALVDKETSVSIRLFEHSSYAREKNRQGLIRLLRFRLGSQFKFAVSVMKHLRQTQLLATHLVNHKQLVDDLQGVLADSVFLKSEKEWPHNKEAFESLVKERQSELVPDAEALDQLLFSLFTKAQAVTRGLKGRNIPFEQALSLADIKHQLERLIFPGFMTAAGMDNLSQYPRYLEAILQRLEKLPGQLSHDCQWTQELDEFQKQLVRAQGKSRKQKQVDTKLEAFRWKIEEYRVSLFAQRLGTRYPVSGKRLRKAWSEVDS
ncbi:hypothetical protein CI610_01517 [invertebrate metagenome]|uniref:ATP-dependent RNA helicase HrpA n=1 Tax=invertebrate metagenome TaxID=1711999 RepID=A0A2H9T8E6_9ZZZZ